MCHSESSRLTQLGAFAGLPHLKEYKVFEGFLGLVTGLVETDVNVDDGSLVAIRAVEIAFAARHLMEEAFSTLQTFFP